MIALTGQEQHCTFAYLMAFDYFQLLQFEMFFVGSFMRRFFCRVLLNQMTSVCSKHSLNDVVTWVSHDVSYKSCYLRNNFSLPVNCR